ncbi:MAG: hypothetical protein BroJett011_62540 [Chloroflexota bacterium]|nr:MAG: hypothetical protein BroJett011_62540 [Chloroflexota bacterium]
MLAQAEGRVLRPASLLRPLRLDKAANLLGDFGRQARVLALIQTNFPDDWQGEWAVEAKDWFEHYCEFLRAVEAKDWFEIDWPTLQMWEQNWMETGDDECAGFDIPSDYLLGIPVYCFGWDVTEPELEMGDPATIQDYPALELLRFLVLGTEKGRVVSDYMEQMLETLGFYRLDYYSRNDARARLERAGRRQKPPWKWLAEMADFACDRSGNIILDTTVDSHDPWPCRWTWDKDLETIKGAWARAKPTVEHFREFVDRVNSKDDLEYIAAVAMGKRRRK